MAVRHIPNILSAFRIALIPLIAWQLYGDNTAEAAVILVVSALTDLLDGALARRFDWVSVLGKVLDPAADKLTQMTVCVLLAIKMPSMWYFFVFLLGKELVMLVLGGFLVKKKVKLEGSRLFGKLVTTLFYVVMIALLAFPNLPGWARVLMLCVVTVFALFAGLMYIPQYREYRRQARGEMPSLKETTQQ